MPTSQSAAALAPTMARSARHWIFHLGGLGFIPLGILDNSLIPIPGSMDLLTIFLAARTPDFWPYYALMATAGALLGGFITFRLARKGGKETLARRFRGGKLDKTYKIFARWGFGAIAIPALLPPPAPMVPFLLAAGAMDYSTNKFLLALALGRGLRYAILAYLSARYGRNAISFFSRLQHPMLIAAVAFAAIALVALIVFLLSKSKHHKSHPA